MKGEEPQEECVGAKPWHGDRAGKEEQGLKPRSRGLEWKYRWRNLRHRIKFAVTTEG